jgi:hypothetical protein
MFSWERAILSRSPTLTRTRAAELLQPKAISSVELTRACLAWTVLATAVLNE